MNEQQITLEYFVITFIINYKNTVTSLMCNISFQAISINTIILLATFSFLFIILTNDEKRFEIRTCIGYLIHGVILSIILFMSYSSNQPSSGLLDSVFNVDYSLRIHV